MGVARPGDLQRTLGTMLIGGTLMLALVAAEVPARRLRVAGAVIALIVITVIIASLTSHSQTAQGVTAVANALLVAVAPPAIVLGLLRHLKKARMITIPVVAGV